MHKPRRNIRVKIQFVSLYTKRSITSLQVAHELGETYNNIVGDVLLSGGIVAYLGPFTVEFRQVSS